MTRHVAHISGPISGVVDNNEGAFRSTEERLRKMGYDVLNPMNIPPDTPYSKAMRINCEWICDRATVMVVLPPRNDGIPSLGSLAEQALARACGIPIYHVMDDGRILGLIDVRRERGDG